MDRERRGRRRAIADLLLSPPREDPEVTLERLATVRSFVELGLTPSKARAPSVLGMREPSSNLQFGEQVTD